MTTARPTSRTVSQPDPHGRTSSNEVGAASGAGRSATLVVATTTGRPAAVELAFAGAAFFGGTLLDRPVTGLAGAIAVLFFSHWQRSLPRDFRGHAGVRHLRRAGHAR